MRTAKEWARQFPTDIGSDAQIEPLIKRIQEDAREDFKPVVEALRWVIRWDRSESITLHEMIEKAKHALAHAEKLMEGK